MVIPTDVIQSNMSDVSRSFLVDSLILKTPRPDKLPVSPAAKSPDPHPAPLRGLGGFTSLPHQLAANHQAFHCFPRPPGAGGGLLDLYCPWCPSGTALKAPGMPGLGMVPIPVSTSPTSGSVAASAVTAAAMSAAATFQQQHQQLSQQQQQQQRQQQHHSSRVMKPVVNKASAPALVQPYMIPHRTSLGSLPGSSSAFRPRSLDPVTRAPSLNLLETRRLPYLGMGTYFPLLVHVSERNNVSNSLTAHLEHFPRCADAQLFCTAFKGFAREQQ